MYEPKVVRERRPGDGPACAIRTSAEVYAAFRTSFDAADREEVLALSLDGKNRVQGLHVVSVRSLTASLVHPREVYRAAIVANAAAIIAVHNQPSGDPTPSVEDHAITRRLKEAGELLGITLLDHVVIGDGSVRLFADDGLLFSSLAARANPSRVGSFSCAPPRVAPRYPKMRQNRHSTRRSANGDHFLSGVVDPSDALVIAKNQCPGSPISVDSSAGPVHAALAEFAPPWTPEHLAKERRP